MKSIKKAIHYLNHELVYDMFYKPSGHEDIELSLDETLGFLKYIDFEKKVISIISRKDYESFFLFESYRPANFLSKEMRMENFKMADVSSAMGSVIQRDSEDWLHYGKDPHGLLQFYAHKITSRPLTRVTIGYSREWYSTHVLNAQYSIVLPNVDSITANYYVKLHRSIVQKESLNT